jgi:hypothetical protein
MKKFLVVMIASCFSFGFICPAYGSWPIGLFPFSSSSEDELCIKAKKSFINASFEFVNGLEKERLFLEEKQDNSTGLIEIQKQNMYLEKKLNVSKRAMVTLCGEAKPVTNKNLQNTNYMGNEL